MLIINVLAIAIGMAIAGAAAWWDVRCLRRLLEREWVEKESKISAEYSQLLQYAHETKNQKLIAYLQTNTIQALPSIKELKAEFGCQFAE